MRCERSGNDQGVLAGLDEAGFRRKVVPQLLLRFRVVKRIEFNIGEAAVNADVRDPAAGLDVPRVRVAVHQDILRVDDFQPLSFM
jgi:hypothetical protein